MAPFSVCPVAICIRSAWPSRAPGAASLDYIQVSTSPGSAFTEVELRVMSPTAGSLFWFDGTTYALRSTLDKALKLELGQWCQAHGVKHAGLLPKK